MVLSENYIDQSRSVCDPSADNLVSSLFKAGRHNDLYAIFRSNEPVTPNLEPSIRSFLKSSKPKPDWYDEVSMIQGQLFFKEYASEIMTLLGVMSLPYCYAGSPGNKALYASEKMRKNPAKRLADTAEYVIGVLTPGSFDNGNAISQINRTRLAHAIARFHILKGEWNMAWGMPINQEDMAATNLAFSYIILNGLRKLGFNLSRDKKDTYMLLWRYIGYQLGIDERLLPADYMEGFRMNKTMKRRNLRSSLEGEVLAAELLKYYHKQAPSSLKPFVNAQVRYFIGDRIAGYLGLKREPIKEGIVSISNGVRESQNFFSSHKSTWTEMIANQSRVSKSLIDA